MATLEAFLRDVTPAALRCPAMMAMDAIRDAAAEFCERTLVWRVLFDGLAADAAGDLNVSPPPNGEVERVLEVWADGERLEPALESSLDRARPGWRDATGRPGAFIVYPDHAIRLYPAPGDQASTSIRVQSALKPADAAEVVPDLLFKQWRQPITAGARARILDQPGMPWFNAGLAAVYRQQFRDGVSRAKAAMLKGNTTISRRVRFFETPPDFCGTQAGAGETMVTRHYSAGPLAGSGMLGGGEGVSTELSAHQFVAEVVDQAGAPLALTPGSSATLRVRGRVQGAQGWTEVALFVLSDEPRARQIEGRYAAFSFEATGLAADEHVLVHWHGWT